MRARIIQALRERAMNAHQLAMVLGVDYSTVRHHLHILVEHQVVECTGGSYGTAYFLTEPLMELYPRIGAILEKAGQRQPLQLAAAHRRPARPELAR